MAQPEVIKCFNNESSCAKAKMQNKRIDLEQQLALETEKNPQLKLNHMIEQHREK